MKAILILALTIAALAPAAANPPANPDYAAIMQMWANERSRKEAARLEAERQAQIAIQAQIAEELRQMRIEMQLEAARRRGEAIAIYR
jgi:hypothetical protein